MLQTLSRSLVVASKLAMIIPLLIVGSGSAHAISATIDASSRAAIVSPQSPAAAPIVLTFEGLAWREFIGDFYNGGTGSLGSGPAQNFGISFLGLATVYIENGGPLIFHGEPSPRTIGVFESYGGPIPPPVYIPPIINVPRGFTTGFSFFYISEFQVASSIKIYDGLNGTGNVLATLNIPASPPDPISGLPPFVPIGVAFTGTAKSVDFTRATYVFLDNVTFGSGTPGGVPVPYEYVPIPLTSPAGLAALAGLIMLAGGMWLRWRRGTR